MPPFAWPKGASWLAMAERVKACLAESPELGPLCDDPKFRLHLLISRTCLEYGLHPAWLLVSLCRERSLLRGTEAFTTPKDYDYACGFVGSDAPGTTNPGWNGLTNQIWRCARHTAWYLGMAPKQCFGYEPGLWPTQPRWGESKSVWLTTDKVWHKCQGADEYAQLMYTPHLEVLDVNQTCYDKFVAEYF